MGERQPSSERPPSADILHAFTTILQPSEGERSRVDKRDFGDYQVTRSVIFVGYRREIPQTTYELLRLAPAAQDGYRYAYQTVGLQKQVFLDGERLDLDTGERLLQEAVNKALEAYEIEVS